MTTTEPHDSEPRLTAVITLHGDCTQRCGICHECGQQFPCRTLDAATGTVRFNETPTPPPAGWARWLAGDRTAIHDTPHPLAGEHLLVDVGHGPTEFHCEDWWDRVSGTSWMTTQGNPAAINYAIRTARQALPLDDNVVYGKIGRFGHLVHVTEIRED